MAISCHADNQGVIGEWNSAFLESVSKNSQPPCLVARNLAILHLAIWRSVEAYPNEAEFAAIYAAHEVASRMFPSEKAAFDQLLLRQKGATSFEYGRECRLVAAAVLEEREEDGSNTTIHFEPELAFGVWRRTTNNRPPELPHWDRVRPFALKKADQFRPGPPPAINSAEFGESLKEVVQIGGENSQLRSIDQTQAAHFWADFSYTTTPPGRWNQIACSQLGGLSIQEQAKVLMVLNIALADAGIAAWDCKMHYRFWRPQTAVEEMKDASAWVSLLASPSHPEYVSGHSTFSGAAAHVLEQLLPVEGDLEVMSEEGLPSRNFGSYREIANEIGLSRVWGGIHYDFSNEAGNMLGRQVAAWVLLNCSDRRKVKN